MEWILIVWVLAAPESTGVITQPDEVTCERGLSTWEGISKNHSGICVYGNLKELNLEIYQDIKQ